MLKAAFIQARSGRGYAWIGIKWPPNESASDHSQFLHDLQWGRLSERTQQPQFSRLNKGQRFGDLLWTTGPTKIASDRFVNVLSKSGATGYSTFPVTVPAPSGTASQRYHGLVIFGRPGDDDCFSLRPEEQHWTFGVRQALLDNLHDAGADDFDIVAPPPWWGAPR